MGESTADHSGARTNNSPHHETDSLGRARGLVVKAPPIAACALLLSLLMMSAQPAAAVVDAAGAQHPSSPASFDSTTSTQPGLPAPDAGDQPGTETTVPEPATSSAPLALAALGAVVAMVAVLAFTYRRFRPDD